MPKTISFILPVYKNESSLQELHSRLTAVMNKDVKGLDYTMIFVVDGSPDNSIEVLKKITAKDPSHVRVLSLSRNFGHQAAVTAGIDYATGDAIILMDADLQDPPQVCPELIEQWQNGYDVVYAQRRPRKDYPWFRRMLSDMYYGALAKMSSVDIPRNVGDFRLIDKKVADVIRSMKEYHRFLRGLVAYAGFKQTAVEFDRDPRFDDGKTSYSFKKLVQLAKDGIFGFSDSPLRLLAPIGVVGALLSAMVGLHAFLSWLFWPQLAIPGWGAVIIAVFFVGSLQLIALGVVAEYLGRTYDEVRRRPTYIVAEEFGDAK
ncbi:MAG TPA: glycosyltransferase [Magnetospirillaceae bacterium]|nr:glycosyltransferase [Magnetospirillaceae bacterium]